MILLDEASGFLRSRSLTSLTWVGLIMSSEDEEQRDPSSSVSVSFKDKLEAGPGLNCFGSFPSQRPVCRLVSWGLSHGSMMAGPVGPAEPIDRDILPTNQQLIKSLMRGW